MTHMSSKVHAADETKFKLSISVFPESLHSTLQAIDDEGNGERACHAVCPVPVSACPRFLPRERHAPPPCPEWFLVARLGGAVELDELTEVFTMFADMKKAAKEGSIALSTLPKEVQPSLKVFDVDGDGTVAPLELARAAELYKESKNSVKRLTRAVVVLFLVLVALVGTIIGLTAVVIEESKETKVDSSGVTTVKGADTPAATAAVLQQTDITAAFATEPAALDAIKSLYFINDELELSYTVTGWRRSAAAVTFYTARGDTVQVTAAGALTVTSAAGETLGSLDLSANLGSARRLLSFHGALMTSGSFTMMASTTYG